MLTPPIVRELVAHFRSADTKVSGIAGLSAQGSRLTADVQGLWWVVPLAAGAAGPSYGIRLHPGPGHGAVVRYSAGHAVTVAADVSGLVPAMLLIERLLVAPKFRTRVQGAWASVGPWLADATRLCGGDPDVLDRALHVADDLSSTAPATPEEDARRRVLLGQILGDERVASSPAGDPIWGRAQTADPIVLLGGNHGLDGTHVHGGLFPSQAAARESLVHAARCALAPSTDTRLASMIRSIAEHGRPDADALLEAALGVGPVRAWDALATASFWVNAATGHTSVDFAKAGADIARAAGADAILALRAAVD